MPEPHKLTNMRLSRKYIKLFIVASSVVVADQISKWLILGHMPLYDSVTLIPGFFNLTHIRNPGGAFGFLSDHSSHLRSVVFLLVSIFAVGLIFWFYLKTPASHSLLATGFALIFGGAIGNMIDRVRFGEVIDFLDFYVGTLHWPAFNIADSAITIGIVIFLGHLLLKKIPE